MKRTYYIMEHDDRRGNYWKAYKRGISSTLGFYDYTNEVVDTMTFRGADDCERLVRIKVKKPRLIRVVRS